MFTVIIPIMPMSLPFAALTGDNLLLVMFLMLCFGNNLSASDNLMREISAPESKRNFTVLSSLSLILISTYTLLLTWDIWSFTSFVFIASKSLSGILIFGDKMASSVFNEAKVLISEQNFSTLLSFTHCVLRSVIFWSDSHIVLCTSSLHSAGISKTKGDLSKRTAFTEAFVLSIIETSSSVSSGSDSASSVYSLISSASLVAG